MRISSLPTSSTSTDGMSVIPSSTPTSFERNLRERQAAPPLDHHLEDVPREHEHQREDHREVGGRQRVEHELGEEVRARAATSAIRTRASPPAPPTSRAMLAMISSGLSRNGRRPDDGLRVRAGGVAGGEVPRRRHLLDQREARLAGRHAMFPGPEQEPVHPGPRPRAHPDVVLAVRLEPPAC